MTSNFDGDGVADSKVNNSFAFVITLFLLSLLVVLGISYFGKKIENRYFENDVKKEESIARNCTEGFRKIERFNIYTCIDDQWVYTGDENDIKG